MELVCRRKPRYEHLSNSDWVNYQLKCNLNCSLRDVLLHTSFIEAILIDLSDQRPYEFRYTEKENCKTCNPPDRTVSTAISILKKELAAISSGEEEKLFRDLFKKRNELIHGIAKRPTPLTQDQIEKKRNSMYQKIQKIYNTSSLIGNAFEDRCYNVSLARKRQKTGEGNCSEGDT